MDRGRWEKSIDMTFKVIQGQGQGHEALKVAKMAIFKVYLLRHLLREVGFDYGLWIYGTISKIHRAGFFNFAFVFEIFDFELYEKRYFVPTSNECYSVTQSWRVKLMGSMNRVANGLSQSINTSRVPRTTWLSRELELSWPTVPNGTIFRWNVS